VTAALLDDVERLIRNGDASTIVRCCSPAGLELAAAVLDADDMARRDFGTATAIAAYLRGLAQPQERAARRALAEPDRPPTVPLNVAGVVHGAIADARRNPPPSPAIPPVDVRASMPPASTPARPPEPIAPPVQLSATPKTETAPARLSMAQAGERLGLPMHRLPATRGVVEALRDAGLNPSIVNGIDIELNAGDVNRVARDREAQERLLLRLANTVREFGYVDSGHEVRFGT
jgi:hypothetical protein